MATHHEEELAHELRQRGLSRREILQIGARLGLSGAAIATVLAACGQAPQQPGTGAAPTIHSASN